MKIGTIIAATAVSAMIACNSGALQEAAKDSVTATEQTPVEAPAPGFVTGIVEEVTMGKDGYTAKIRSAQDSVYYVTISHANLTDHSQYKSAKAGDTLHVSGDRWEMEGKAQITVRELK